MQIGQALSRLIYHKVFLVDLQENDNKQVKSQSFGMRETDKSQPQQPKNACKFYFAYVSQLILFILIICYCIVSPSLFSAIGVFFMMISIEANLTKRYKLKESVNHEKALQSEDLLLRPYPLERIIWSLYTIINISSLIFKIIIVTTNSQSNYSQNQQQFFQIQDLLHMFLPTTLLPFAIASILIKPRTKRLKQFRKEISQKITIPSYFLLGGLCILVQIWSQSIIGILYFVISFAIFCIKNTNFNNVFYHIIVRIIQLSTILVIPFSFIASTSLFLGFGISQYYETIGIDGVYNLNQGLQPPAHFATQITLFLYCCLLHRLFEYQRLNNIATEKIDAYSMSVRQIIGGQNIDYSDHKPVFLGQNSPCKTLRQSLLNKRGMETGEDKEYELQQSFRANDSARHISLLQPHIDRSWSQNLKQRQSEHLSHKKTDSMSHKQKNKKKQKLEKTDDKEPMLQKIVDTFLKIVNKIISFLNSSDFTLRVAEVIAIVIIQRYNNVYSFLVLVWLAIIASIQNLKVVYRITAFILLPVEVVNYVILFLYNVPNSPFSEIVHKSIWGFQPMYAYWLDVIIFNVFLYYLILFVSAASKQTRSSLYSTSNKVSEPSNVVLFLAFVFRYTYLFTIFGMFFLGFSNITCIDLGYVILFFLFFTFGQNLTLYKKNKKKRSQIGEQREQKVYVLTTLSRKFWFIIVYYTLIVIVLKYVYFLFFEGQAKSIMDPLGINEIYNMAFNFSLTSICKSNTTPFFLIFVLAESQIIIHRSSIYLNYSFSLIATSNNRKLKQQKNEMVTSKSEKLKILSQKLICFFLQFYFQGLYYISGIIILACSSSWNIVQVPLVILTCIGLLRKFNTKILVLIIIIDLLFIFATYVFRFLNYISISNMLGQDLTDVLKKIALFCGFNLDPNQSLYEIIVFNVVIIYFAVESYRLCIKLDQKMIENQALREQFEHHESVKKENKKKGELHQSEYQPTVIDSQFGDKKFALNYQKGVIQATKTYYNTDIVKKYSWLRYLCKFFSFIIVDAVSIIVLVCCLYFRLSVSMFMFLIVYLIFYYFLFDRIGIYLSQENYIGKIEAYLQSYKQQEVILQQKTNPRRVENSKQKINELKEFTSNVFQQILNYKYRWKKTLWVYSAVFSVACLILTYIAQFLVSDFFVQNIHWDSTGQIQDVLFILGFSVNNQTSFFRQVYFYYLMIIINVFEKLLINFFEKEKQEEEFNILVQKEFKEIIKIDNSALLINEPEVTRDFIEQEQVFEKLKTLDEDEDMAEEDEDMAEEDDGFQFSAMPAEADVYEKELICATNILIYFNYKEAQVKINIIYALLAVMVRFYLWLMLINVYQRTSFSAFLYLFTIFYFWFRKIQFTVVKDINKAAIIIFLIQYLMLLLDIQQNTSPLPLPNNNNLSLLQRYITDQEWLRFLVIGQNESKTSFIFVSFMVNSIIIFVTQLYFSGFQYISRLCLKITQEIWDRYNYIYQTILKTGTNQTLDLNYESYKSWSYRVLQFTYQNFIINSYAIVSILILLILSADHTYISLTLLVIVFVYIFIARYTQNGTGTKIYDYTIRFFSVFRIILFIFISLFVFFGLPFLQSQISTLSPSIGISITLSQIFLLLFIQLWLDCAGSREFQRITCEGLKKLHQKERVKLQCLAYQSNNSFMISLIDTFKEIMSFQINIKQAHQIIKEWENTFKVEQMLVKQQNEGIKGTDEMDTEEQGVVSPALKALRIQIQRQEARKEQESEEKPFLQVLQQFLSRNTNCSLSYSYFELMKYVVRNNKKVLQKILNKEKINIDIWDYILEDYQKLEEQTKKCEQKLKQIGQRIIDSDDEFGLQYLNMIIDDEYMPKNDMQEGGNYISPTITHEQNVSNVYESNLYKVTTPKKINLVIGNDDEKKKLSKTIWFFALANFNYFLLFMIFIYYTINPSLLSLPLIGYIFVYYVIADKKYNKLIFVYIFIIIILAQLFQLQFFEASDWTEFFFYLPQNDTYHFSIGFLFFLLVLILIDEQIKRYQGANQIHQSEVQSFETACLRMLINEQQTSETYLWKMYFEDQDQYEHNNNPIFYAEQIIFENSKNLIQKPEHSFFDIFYSNKPGIDLYPYIATVQIFLTIYLIFFYPLMTLKNQSDLSESLKYFTFSSNMIIAILSHVFVIVAERKITLISSQNPHKELIKYIFTMIIFSLFLIFIYFWASQTEPHEYQPQPALIAFSFFYFIYFFFSGLQVKYGYKKFKKINSFMVKRDTPRYFFMLIFTAIPFLYQIKCIMDWTFLQTSLQLFDWFKLFSIYVSSFKAKMQQSGTLQTNLGEKVNWSGKMIGWVGFTLLLLIIFGPMILFSGLNPTAVQNLVNGGSFQLGVHVVGGNQFTLYSTSHFSNPPLQFTQEQFDANGFNDVPELRTLTEYDISRQFQNVTFETYSDQFWGASPPNYNFLKKAFNASTYQMENNQTVEYGYRMTIDYILNRQVPETTASLTTFQFPNSNLNLTLDIVSQLNTTFHTCNSSTTIPGLYNSLIRLITTGTTYKPSPIFYANEEGIQQYLQNITLTMICTQPNAVLNEDTNNIYWEVTLEGTKAGIQMYVYADLYQSLLGGLSFTAIYTSVILVVAGFIRGFLAGNLPLIPYEMNAKPQKILQICQAIGIHRERKQFKEQFLMYYELIDVIRSPEIIRKLGTSYTNLIAKNNRVKKMKQINKQQREKKKNL